MKLVFVGDNLSIHQKPLSDALFSILGEDYLFVATNPITSERINMGWHDYTEEVPYALYVNERNYADTKKRIDEADAVIVGAARTQWVKDRLKKNKLVFRYQERPFKRTSWLGLLKPKSILGIFRSSVIWQRKNYHLLAASAYAYNDFSKWGCFKKRAWKFGYFINPIQTSYVERNNEEVLITWVGRMLVWKKCDMVVYAAQYLKQKGIRCRFVVVGNGPLSDDIRELSERLKVDDLITFYASKTNEDVRSLMSQSDIHLITSDYNEGWGVVTNEAMSAGCCVISSKATGAAPFLIEHGENGFLFDPNRQEELNALLENAVLDKNLRMSVGRSAIDTMNNIWSADNAAKQLVSLVLRLQSGDYSQGNSAEKKPCTAAGKIKFNR